MIKKDIDPNYFPKIPTQNYSTSATTEDSVDSIFREADLVMDKQSGGRRLRACSEKRRCNPFSGGLTSFLIILAGVIFVLCSLGNYFINEMYPSMVDSVVTQFHDAREHLVSIDDEDLTLEEYYQKQILLLVTDEDVVNAFDDALTLETFVAILIGGEDVVLDLVPADKIDEYNEIIEEYRQVVEAANESTILTESQTVSETE
jgi:hypothetical protein